MQQQRRYVSVVKCQMKSVNCRNRQKISEIREIMNRDVNIIIAYEGLVRNKMKGSIFIA